MKEYYKPNSHISSKIHMFYISSNNDRHPIHKTFTPLHCASRHITSSYLNFAQLHFITLSFGLTPLKFPTAPFRLTSHIRTVKPRYSTILTAFERMCAEIPNYTILPLTATLNMPTQIAVIQQWRYIVGFDFILYYMF